MGILVILAGVVVFLISLVGTLLGVLATLGSGGDPLYTLVLVLGVVGLVLGIVLILAGGGLLRLRPWAWWLATIVLLLYVGDAILTSYSTETIGLALLWALIIPIVVIVYLIAVRRHFRSPAYL